VPNVLVVEDDTTLREMMALNLRAEGYEVRVAESGDAGLELARQAAPDLIILDIMLPRLDGLTLLRLLRKESQVPVIVLTARGTEADKIIGLETGADDYIVKPFSLGEFLARVRATLRRVQPQADREVELVSGDLRLDLLGRRAYRAGELIALAPREFDLLAMLMRHRGAVLTRALVVSRVWGDDFPGDDRTVDVHIRWLRQKIEANPSHPDRIVTVRGIGYRFEG
jgi:DNA-binding response OmpR family regulator